MDTLCLKNYGVSSMEVCDMKAVQGGVIPVAVWYIGSFVLGVIVGLVIAFN